MIPSPEQIHAVKELIGSRGFAFAIMSSIVGLVVWGLLSSVTNSVSTIPGKLDDIISRLETCSARSEKIAESSRLVRLSR